MKIQIFAVHDSKAHAYLQPFFLNNKELALRLFKQSVNDPETNFHQFPLDYTLFHIGEYDDEIALITAQAPPEMLITADQCIDKTQKFIPNKYEKENS